MSFVVGPDVTPHVQIAPLLTYAIRAPSGEITALFTLTGSQMMSGSSRVAPSGSPAEFAAELAASKDDTQRAKVDSARTEFERLKSKFVEYRKQLQVREENLVQMHQESGMGGGRR